MTQEQIDILDRSYLSDLTQRLDEPGVCGRLVLWIKLSSGRIPGFKFVHNHPVAGYRLDFYCPEIKLGIDVEVSNETNSKTVDETRLKVLESHGVIALTFTDEEIIHHTDDVVEHIRILATAFGRISDAA